MTVKAETRGAKPGLAFVTEVLLGSDLCTAQAAGERLLCGRWGTAPGLDPAARSLRPAKSHQAEQEKALCNLAHTGISKENATEVNSVSQNQ